MFSFVCFNEIRDECQEDLDNVDRDTENKKIEIKADNGTLQQVNRFIYLGTELREDIKTEKKIERRSNIAKKKVSAMSKLLTSKKLQLKTKMNVLKSYIYSIFTYGCKTWTLSKANENKVEVFEMWCLRSSKIKNKKDICC